MEGRRKGKRKEEKGEGEGRGRGRGIGEELDKRVILKFVNESLQKDNACPSDANR